MTSDIERVEAMHRELDLLYWDSYSRCCLRPLAACACGDIPMNNRNQLPPECLQLLAAIAGPK
jgi:hypothetical protein